MILKREAASNSGLRNMARDIGENYHKVWNQMNRNQGVLADLVVILARHGFDRPLRIMAEAAGHDVIPKLKFLRKAHPGKSVRSFELDVHHATSALTLLVEDALSDKRLSSMEKDAIKAAAQKARVEIAELVAKIEGGGIMKTEKAICVGCLKVRNLAYGNPPLCKCGSREIVWVSSTVEQCRASILADKAQIEGEGR